jgi:hypothetical protein
MDAGGGFFILFAKFLSISLYKGRRTRWFMEPVFLQAEAACFSRHGHGHGSFHISVYVKKFDIFGPLFVNICM